MMCTLLITLVIGLVESSLLKHKLELKQKNRLGHKQKLSHRMKHRMRNKQYYTDTFAYSVPDEDSVHQVSQTSKSADSSCPNGQCGSPSCPPCILAKTERNIHDRAQKDALADEKTQDALMKEAELQEKLFNIANKYALQTAQYEEKARNLTLELQKVSSQAETSRAKMLKAESQAKQLALKTIHTMTVYPPHQATHTPELAVTNAGYEQTQIKEVVPQYDIKIGGTDQSGYIDPLQDSINQDIASNSKEQDQFIQHHENQVNFAKPLEN